MIYKYFLPFCALSFTFSVVYFDVQKFNFDVILLIYILLLPPVLLVSYQETTSNIMKIFPGMWAALSKAAYCGAKKW